MILSKTNTHSGQRERMLEASVPKLVITLAIPTIISMMVSAIYNMADTYFVSQINTSASGAVGIVFSIMALIAGSLLTCFGLLFLQDFVWVLGATQTIYPYALDYATYI